LVPFVKGAKDEGGEQCVEMGEQDARTAEKHLAELQIDGAIEGR
jgi:hypothetical protein